MKRVTASDARRLWFRLLDEALEGEVIMIERKGRRLVLKSDESRPTGEEPPDYSEILHVPNAEHADRWHWEWTEGELELKEDES